MIWADLSGKAALVTGGAAGIGLATATLLARMGASVAVNDLPQNTGLTPEVERLRSRGYKATAAPGDVGNPDDVQSMVQTVVAKLGRLDYLINNAATPGTSQPIPPGDLERQTEAFWQRLLSVNLLGPFRCTKAAAPHLKAAHGAVVNTASISALAGGGSSSAYCATKAALVNLTKELARGLAPEVRVNAIAPGIVHGSAWECKWDPAWMERAIAGVPLQRAGTPTDYAEVILFLCAGAGYITGETIVVDGGLRA
jgi:3-oxoacyl-[acyl-carrier protein] reductase